MSQIARFSKVRSFIHSFFIPILTVKETTPHSSKNIKLLYNKCLEINFESIPGRNYQKFPSRGKIHSSIHILKKSLFYIETDHFSRELAEEDMESKHFWSVI